jgi:hypothetical protein
VVVWNSRDQDGDDWGVFGQRYDADGVPLGGEFQVNTYTTGGQRFGAVAADADGNFVVFWSSARPGGFTVVGQRYDAVGNSVGEEFRASSGPQYGISDPAVATDADNDFVVVWTDDTAIFGRRFDAAGTPVGADFHISQESFGNTQYTPAIAVGQSGEFVVVWTSA